MTYPVKFVPIAVALVFFSMGAHGFVGSGPSPRVPPPAVGDDRRVSIESRPNIEETAEKSPFSCEVLYVGETVVRGEPDDLCFDSNLSPMQARAIAIEASASKTVPKDTILDALHFLAYSSEQARSNGESLTPAEKLDGIWSLCFSGGEGFPRGLEVDQHGYVSRQQRVEVKFDMANGRLVVGSSGLLDASIPDIMQGDMAYSLDTETLFGAFEQEKTTLAPLVLQVCLADEQALAFRTISPDGGKSSFLLFEAERSRAAARRLQREASVSPAEISAKTTAAASVAGNIKFEIPAELRILHDEMAHETKRMEVEEKGRKVGSFNSFMRYFETEGGMLYAALAGPTIAGFMKFYTPTAIMKTAATVLVIEGTLRHFFNINT